MDNERVLDILEQIRSEIARMNIALERHNLQLEANNTAVREAKTLAEKAIEAHNNCVARRKHEGNTLLFKDIVLYGSAIGVLYSALVKLGVIK